jgi:hypothetical protein
MKDLISLIVIPPKAGIQIINMFLDAGFRRHDGILFFQGLPRTRLSDQS